MQGNIKMTMKLEPLKRLQKQSPKLFKKALEKGAIQFITWANTGSVAEPRTPPIRWGVLRGSSSAFVGNKLVTIFPQSILPAATEKPTPARSHTADPLTITWAWNTNYAAKMHEWKGGWGKFTQQAGNAGNKWLEKHLRKDRNALLRMIGMEFKKEVGM